MGGLTLIVGLIYSINSVSFNYKMFFSSSSKLTQTREGEDLSSPTALTSFYMDTFMCNEFHLKS